MTQVLEHNYGKGRVTRRQIRAAIKAVKAAKAAAAGIGKSPIETKATKKATALKSGCCK
jgi:hypothetical protein